MDPSKMDMMEFMKGLNDPTSPFYVPPYEFEIIPYKGLKNGVKTYKGHILPFICRNPVVIKEIDVKETDTFVVTFPK